MSEKMTVNSLEEMKRLADEGVIKPTKWEWIAMQLIESNKELKKFEDSLTRKHWWEIWKPK